MSERRPPFEPQLELDDVVLRGNAQAWRSRAAAPLRAVVKADGYGWGVARVMAAVEAVVDGFLVGDVEEFERARPHTARPIATLADVSADEVGRVLERGGIPSLSDPAAFGAAGGWALAHGCRALVRLGVRSAVSWGGVDPDELPALARAIASLPLDVEAWTHLTDPRLAVDQRRTFADALVTLRRCGVSVAAHDVASTAQLAEGADGAGVRLGAGMYGFRFGASVPGVVSALRLRAPLVRTLPSRGQLVGYGTARAPDSGWLAVARCGYGDGLPRVAQPRRGILAVGMQYAVVHSETPPVGSELTLVDAATDLDTLAGAAQTSAHEVIVRLGHAAAAKLHAAKARASSVKAEETR